MCDIRRWNSVVAKVDKVFHLREAIYGSNERDIELITENMMGRVP